MTKPYGRRSLLLFFLLVMLITPWAQGIQEPATASFYSSILSIDLEGELVEVEFRNGMKVVIEERFGIPLVAIDAIVIPSSGRFREDQLAGLESLSREIIKKEVLALGGFVESFSFRGAVIVRVTVPSEELEEAIKLLGKLDNPDQKIQGRTALGKPGIEPISAMPDIDEIINEALPKPAVFLPDTEDGDDADVTPGPTVCGLSISGSVQHEILLGYIAETFAGKKFSGISGIPPSDNFSDNASKEVNPKYKVSFTDLDFSLFTISYRIPGKGESQRIHCQVIKQLVGGGTASLIRVKDDDLSRNFQHRVDIVDRESDSYLVVTGAAVPDFLDKAEQQVLASMTSLASANLPDAVVTRARNLEMLDFLQGIETLPDRADTVAEMLIAGRIVEPSDHLQVLAGIDKDSLRKTAGEFLDHSKASVREFLPRDMKRSFTEEAYFEALDILLPSAVSGLKENLEKLSYTAPELSFSLPGRNVNLLPPSLKKSSILRGPDLYLYEFHQSPLVRIGIFFPGGFREERGINAGITEILVANMLESWSLDGFDSRMLYLEGMGAKVEGVINPDYFGFRATLLSNGFEPVFSELIKLIRDFEPGQDLLSSFRNNRKFSSYLSNTSRPSEYPDSLIPLGSRLEYRPASRNDGATEKPASDWYEKISGSHPEIVIYGDVNGTSFLRAMVPRLSNSKLKKYNPPRRRRQGVEKMTPLKLSSSRESPCRFVISGLPAGSGREESLEIISRYQDGSGMMLEWLNLIEKGYCLVSTGMNERQSNVVCTPEGTMRVLKDQDFNSREFNQSKVRAITSFYLETEDAAKMLDRIILGALSGKRGDFIRQQLVDLKQVRVAEVESVKETVFME